ncbi:MAG TPA: regulatory iron-sulfur-containing complex subunit RicT [Gemmataceae bacterium]|jgi:cell fate regulator YaaT (PSP1 superfamily)|nr:regulatory iron-sulfur-containing complex subunit RicT [Gemmataceae bacterium]
MSSTPTLDGLTRYIVRHGAMRLMGEFVDPDGAAFERGTRVVVRTERGQEVGEVLCPSSPQAVAHLPEPTQGEIVRPLSADDRNRDAELRALSRKQFEVAARLVAEHKLQMQFVDVEPLFGGERLIFYFLADKRVDFRELVRAMAREFQTRIELRQIGVRDEAKLLADYGDCGKPVCCNTHMSVMPPVSMRMAKIQKSTLDPSKISGRCGRLKCCLRFEQDVYDEFQQQLPNIGVRILTAKGQGRVLAQEILARRVLVEFEDGRRLPVAADEILTKL